MSPFHSVGAKLSLALMLVVAGALSLVYLVVVPLLEDNLIDAKLSQLEQAAPILAFQLPENQFDYPDFLDTASGSTNARIVILTVLNRRPAALSVFDHSFGVEDENVREDPVAKKVAETQRAARGVVTSGQQRFAEAAVPIGSDYVLLLRAPLADSLETVRLVRKRLLIAGLLAASRRSSRAVYAGSSVPRSGSPPASSTSRSSTPTRTSSASSRGRSTGCGSASRSSTTRGTSSSRTRRTSCGRRSSRSPASSSCSTTRTWTRARGRSSWRR
jgi:hypothetical protein